MPKPVSRRRRVLFLFSASESRVRMLAKGNVWYLRHYECSFDRVFFVYLWGGGGKPVHRGKVILIGLGGKHRLIDLLLSPFRLYVMARRIATPHRLTADVLYSWWATAFAKMLMNFPFVLMPVCMPREIWKFRGSLPVLVKHGLRRLMARLSFWSANHVLTGEAFGAYVHWLQSYPPARRKLIVTRALVDALPTPEFFQALGDVRLLRVKERGTVGLHPDFRLIYVGRLDREKHAGDLILMMKHLLADQAISQMVTLHLVGDGPLRNEMQRQVDIVGLSERVIFHGTVANRDLPALLTKAQVFLSPFTGTSLREAALCGLPVVTYDCDWVSGLLVNEETALMVPKGDAGAMAAAVKRLYMDGVLRENLAVKIQALAVTLWSPSSLNESLVVAFPE